jgi:quercetin dioxygenase-like cupin family protein
VTLTARSSRVAALLVGGPLLVGGVLAGCAQPGQLGRPLPAAPAPVAAPVAVEAPAAPAAPATIGPVSGTVDSRVTIRTPGPAVYSVRTLVLAPGESLDWHRHPGTEMAIVRAGDVTLVREGACTPARYATGQALFIGDAVPHRLANDGTEPAELLVTALLAPGTPESSDAPSACPD